MQYELWDLLHPAVARSPSIPSRLCVLPSNSLRPSSQVVACARRACTYTVLYQLSMPEKHEVPSVLHQVSPVDLQPS
jgi:hypothetical protein